jgi:hypothetical protein
VTVGHSGFRGAKLEHAEDGAPAPLAGGVSRRGRFRDFLESMSIQQRRFAALARSSDASEISTTSNEVQID